MSLVDRLFKWVFILLISLSAEAAFSWNQSYCSDPKSSKNAVGIAVNLYKMSLLSNEYYKEKMGEDFLADELQMPENQVAALYSEKQFKHWKIRKELHAGKALDTVSAFELFDLSAEFALNKLHSAKKIWNLNQVEFLALYSYTSNDFVIINPALRKKTENLQYLDPIVDHIDSGLDKLPVFKGTVLRGVRLKDQVSQKLKVGSLFKDPAYLSTSENQAFGGTYQFKIKSETGREVYHLSANPDEKEILFHRNTEFRITKISKENSTTYIEMTEIPRP